MAEFITWTIVVCITLFMFGCMVYMGWEFFKWIRSEYESEKRRNKNVHF